MVVPIRATKNTIEKIVSVLPMSALDTVLSIHSIAHTDLRHNSKTLPMYCHLPPIYCQRYLSGKNCSKRLKLSREV